VEVECETREVPVTEALHQAAAAAVAAAVIDLQSYSSIIQEHQ
jgi:hypothetical protein